MGNELKPGTVGIFDIKAAETEFAIDTIVSKEAKYNFADPLRCKLEKEDDYFLIRSEMLDIVGTGKTIDDAKICFSEEFYFIYNRYNELQDDNLSDRIKRIKAVLNSLVLKDESRI
ncbi:MAG: hypothetical protein JWQ40_4001 [Segetibacter sp.]|nr:hypothetical protein [Segetibacter sp.]